ncbi:protein of unknown function (plasmid) [Agrobacterium pusense]|uniref:Uncharacterized protein n=1 Tax=Agrobacterium pusense TaxID=648995 RepID=U4Q395_9HYPH|nr:protein of unknown function [Agrobacterium pusense]
MYSFREPSDREYCITSVAKTLPADKVLVSKNRTILTQCVRAYFNRLAVNGVAGAVS